MKKLGLFTLLMLAGAAFAVIDTNPAISYSTPVIYGINVPITSNTPVNVGGQIDSFTIFPNITTNTGLSFSHSTGVLSGTPTHTDTTVYTVTAYGPGGTGDAPLNVKVLNPPTDLTYSSNSAVYAINQPIPNNTPSHGGGEVISYTISQAVPTGMSFNTTTGIISGTPTVNSVPTNYLVTAINPAGTAIKTITLTVLRDGSSITVTLTLGIRPNE